MTWRGTPCSALRSGFDVSASKSFDRGDLADRRQLPAEQGQPVLRDDLDRLQKRRLPGSCRRRRQEAADPFDPEHATQYELGQKSTFLGGALVWNNTLYWMDYTDLQTRRTLPSGAVVTDSAGAATIKGYETYLSWRPFKGGKLVASYGHTDAQFDEYEAEPGVSYAGNQIARVPKHKVVLSPSYDWSLAGGGSVRFAVDYRYESSIWDDNSNEGRSAARGPTSMTAASSTPSRTTAGPWPCGARTWSNEVTRTFQGSFLGANFGAYAPPRTFGVTFNWNH
ncbi:hypothetical protein ACRAWD_30510 [Caulobacter segnis]